MQLLKALVVAVAIIMATTSIAAPKLTHSSTLASMTGNKLVNYMRAFEQEESSFDAGTYMGYVLGVADAYSGISWCPNKQVIVSQVGGIVMKYLNKYPEYWHAAAEGLVFDALKEAFPCKQGSNIDH